MTLRMLFAKWTQTAALLLIGGALAWAIKLGVIISTNGEVIQTGAAALFMKIGLLLLFVGSTGIGHRLGLRLPGFLRALAMVLSPALVIGSFMLFGFISGPLFKDSSVWYAQQEGGIGIAVIVYLIIGIILYKSYRSATR